MRRREFISVIGGAAAAWPFTAGAQQTGKLPTVGYLAANAEAADRPRRTALVQRLAELGWAEGRNVRIEYRWAGGRRQAPFRDRARVGPPAGRRHRDGW
jgi:putative tryptophan/tyrosine transport system substrate-binding protein